MLGVFTCKSEYLASFANWEDLAKPIPRLCVPGVTWSLGGAVLLSQALLLLAPGPNSPPSSTLRHRLMTLYLYIDTIIIIIFYNRRISIFVSLKQETKL